MDRAGIRQPGPDPQLPSNRRADQRARLDVGNEVEIGDGGSLEVLNEAGLAEAGSLLICCPIAEPGPLLHGLAKRHAGLRIAVRLMDGMPSELVSGTDFTVISEDSAAAGDITDVATGKA